MIWTPDGVWLQTVDSSGRVWSHYVGKLTVYSAESFCRERGWRFVAVTRKGEVPARVMAAWHK